ncbi:MAG: SufE family protein [Oligoflexus sp.]
MNISQRKEELINELKSISDKDERLRYIIEQGKAMPAMDPSLKIEPFMVKGCISKAWLAPQKQGERIHFHADSEAMIVKGIIALLLRVYNDSTPDEIITTESDFLTTVGVTDHLSMNRRNGLSNILKMMKTYAAAFRGA